ncbi:MAG: ribosome biogenesis GTPase Der [Alphaproteobacteria bacterium]|nr:ribosome biogenesis GTPase Der [Alphaproteobacteria bacterium]
MPVVAIVGRPNVGKSTLFNRLVGQRRAIVHDTPGVTRDRQYDLTDRYGDREIMVIDTGGFEPNPEDDLFKVVRAQAMAAIDEADVVLLVVDARAGVTPMDKEVGRLLRASHEKVLLVVNKVEGSQQEIEALEFHALGFDELFTVSSEHNQGVGDVMDRVVELLPAPAPELEEQDEDPSEIRIAILGRPNVGKSTLVNRLLGQERQVVSDMPGTTMDAVDTELVVGDRRYVIVDTAGVRRKARVDTQLEGFAVSRSIRTIERCHVTLVVLDGGEGVTEQDARLIHLAADRGRGLILLVNKWDLVREDPERNVRVVEDEIERRLPHARYAPVLYIAALTGKGCHRILPLVEKVYAEFDKRLTTSECNRFLQEAVLNHSVPQRHNRPVRLNYMTQIRVRPPTFVVWCNTPEGVEEPYKRYLVNRMRERYGFEGAPIRMKFRKKRRPGEPIAG